MSHAELFEFPKVDSILCRVRTAPPPLHREVLLVMCVHVCPPSLIVAARLPQMRRKLSLCWGNWVGGRTALIACAQWQLWNFPSASFKSHSVLFLFLSPTFFPGPSRPRSRGQALVGSQRGAHAEAATQ